MVRKRHTQYGGGQKVTTFYKPTIPKNSSQKTDRQILQEQQAARNLRAQKRSEQMPKSQQKSMSGTIGSFLGRGLSNLRENMASPIITPSARRGRGEDVGDMFRGFGSGGYGGINIPKERGIDLSLHPDPMVSGMYRRSDEEHHKRVKKRGNVTEIHYHYH